jgi:hypothetical protein
VILHVSHTEKWPELEADDESSPYNAKGNNAWNITSTSPYFSMAWHFLLDSSRTFPGNVKDNYYI